MFNRRKSRQPQGSTDLDMTSFMNLMVVLVPFLLATAVFSRITILDMSLPGGGAAPTDVQAPPLVLEITLRPDQIEVGDRNSGLMKELPKVDGKHDFAGLNSYLQEVKARFPALLEATLLAEDQTPYDDIVQTMDAVRMYQVRQGNDWLQAELFPEIAMGNAVADPRQPTAGGVTP
ncbi:biopolymer transporter ExbD [Permianibacter sp. IMCC34836]|uniref:ExbD/TolR family protein n=1 Tax=Permianibacter fluminis TaxID=2738515 RepID=UPI0015529A54|nr:biopolymer transporter ExbD [Permianibacter fluminis]NQD38335.1 biopolymer transporter ExbD [Permianibacter fluminis]